MSLADEIERIVPPSKQPAKDKHDQLSMLEEVENILKKLGISLETRFEIPLSSRIRSHQNEKNA